MCGEWVEGGILIDVTSTYEKSVSVFWKSELHAYVIFTI